MKGLSMAAQNLSVQINKIGIKAVIVVIATGVLSLFFPLDAPAPTQEDAAYWLMNTVNGYVIGWLNQIAAMLGFSVVIAVAAWQIFDAAPIRAVTSWVFTFMATMAFFIVKFINIWSVPLMAKALASGSAESVNAEAFLTVLAPLIGFGLGPSLDYLGFAFYAVACLLIFRPLFRLSTSAKVTAIGFLLFGILFFLALAAPYIGLLGQDDMESAALVAALPLLVAFIALVFIFRKQSSVVTASRQE